MSFAFRAEFKIHLFFICKFKLPVLYCCVSPFPSFSIYGKVPVQP